MTITTQPARNEYTANAGQTVFNYTFKIFSSTDLNVYVTPAGADYDDSLYLTTDYVVDPSGIGDEDGGFITLNTAANQDDRVTIVLNVPSSRTIDYQNNGDFRPDTVNSDFDRVVSIAKKVEDLTNRAVLLEQSTQGPKPLNLGEPVPNKIVAWNDDGTKLESSTATIDTLDDAQEYVDFLEVYSNDDISETQTPEGKTVTTIFGQNEKIDEAISKTIAAYIGVWTAGVTTFNEYNEYAVFNGLSYKPKTTTTLPYVAQGADPTVAPDVDFVEPFSDLNSRNISEYTNLVFGSVSDAVNGLLIGGGVHDPKIGDYYLVEDYYGGANPNNSGPLFFKVVAGGTGVVDGGKYIDLPGGDQLEQNLKLPVDISAFGARQGDDVSAAFQNAANYTKQVTAQKGLYYIESPVIFPNNFKFSGGGPVFPWASSLTGNDGTIFASRDGSYAGARWTDIDGGVTDKTDFKPMFVTGVNCELSDFSVASEDGWDAGIFVPATRRNQVRNVTGLANFPLRAPVHVDMTWSDRNTTLTNLHPTVNTDAGANEFSLTECHLEGYTSLLIQGTTRDPDSFTEPNWLWGWGGMSDANFNYCRISNTAVPSSMIPLNDNGDSGALKIDAAVKNGPGAVNRLNFFGCTFRVTGRSRNNCLLDRVGDVNFVCCSGETAGDATNTNWVTSVAPFKVTDNTKTPVNSGITRQFDSIDANIEYNGVGYGRRWTNKDSRPRVLVTHGQSDEYSDRIISLSASDNQDLFVFAQDEIRFQNPNTEVDFLRVDPTTTAGRTTLKSWNNTLMISQDGTVSNNCMQFDSGGFAFHKVMRPQSDNTYPFGTASFRCTELFAVSGTINTSDAREKTEVTPFTEDELKASCEILKSLGGYKWLHAIEKKGDEARLHCGTTVQKAIEILESYKLDPFKYGFICFDEWEDQYKFDDEGKQVLDMKAGNRYGFRYSELTMFLLAGIDYRLSKAGI